MVEEERLSARVAIIKIFQHLNCRKKDLKNFVLHLEFLILEKTPVYIYIIIFILTIF
jgi:hypothetical protein